jgi:hypothetical protein
MDKKPKKKNNCCFIVIILILLFIFCCCMTISSIVLINPLTNLLKMNKPRDLGVSYSQEDLKSAKTKTGEQIIEITEQTKPENSIKYEGSKKLDATFTSKEITAMLNCNEWINKPVRDIQVRFNQDGTTEVSGVIIKDKIKNYALAIGYTEDESNLVSNYLKLGDETAFYIKFNTNVINNNIELDIQKFEIGKFPIPSSMINSNKNLVINIVKQRLSIVTNLDIEQLNVVDGQIHFIGTIPEIKYIEK